MGGSSGGSSSGGGGGGGGNDKKKATPKATPVRARNNKQKARKAKTTPKAPKINYGGNGNNNQRANLPSEVSKPVRPATPIKSTAKTTPVATAKITQPKEERPSGTLRDGLATNKIKTVMGIENDGYGVNESGFAGSSGASLLSVNPAAPKPVNPQDPKLLNEMGITKQARPQFGPLEQGVIPLAGTVAEAQAGQLEILQNLQANPLVRPNFNKDSYDQEALVGKDSLIRGDKYRNDEVSYNQAYYKARLAGGATQAELAAEQKAIGSKKMYSGDRVISEADQDRAKYTLQSLRRSGIDPTVTSEKSGFFDEMTTTKSSYDIGTGKSVTSTVQDYKPNILGVQLGDNITKTFVNGVATYTKTGEGEAKTSDLGSLKQRSQSSPDPIAEMKDIDNQIKTETDPVILKALHKRRLMLMRMNRTNTRFAGLLGEADTKRTNLMSIS